MEKKPDNCNNCYLFKNGELITIYENFSKYIKPCSYCTNNKNAVNPKCNWWIKDIEKI